MALVTDADAPLAVGDRVLVTTTAYAPGGHCVARHDGQVLFVRHALPGEEVLAEITEVPSKARYLRADAVEIRTPSAYRVPPPCPYAGPGLCGGCDLQHADLGYQRELKAGAIREQFQRLAGLDVDVTVEAVPVAQEAAADIDGLRWRTRMEFAIDPAGNAGLRGHRSHDVIELSDCLIATSNLIDSGVLDTEWPDITSVSVVDADHPDEPVLLPTPIGEKPGQGPLVGQAVEFEDETLEYVVRAGGFWQVHAGAPQVLVDTVMRLARVSPGQKVLDLYAGAGLFTVPLALAVGESGRAAVEAGRDNTEDLPWVQWRDGRSEHVVATLVRQRILADTAVLDPPRAGAGEAVIDGLTAMGVERIVYVACDPASLARDVATAVKLGWELTELTAYDLFPMTQHVECVALLERTRP